MSDSVVKLRIDLKEYDANIKRAGQALSDYMQKVREGGGTMKYLDEGVMEAVQALGQLGTKADNTRAGLREMTQTIADLTVQYRALSDEDKGSEFGREMSKALQQLTERAGAMRDAMADTTAAINNAASDTRRFDQLAQGASLVTAGFQGLQGAAKMLGIEMGDNVEVIAKLQAAMAVTNSLTTVQTALQKQSALMQGVMAVQAKAAAVAVELQGNSTKAATVAQAAFNAVAKANPYVLLASAVAAVGLALVGFSKNAKQATEATNTQTDAMKQAQRMADIWKNTMSSTFAQLMTKYDELKRQWMALKDEHSRTEWIKNNKTALQQLGRAVTDVKTAEDFFNNNTDAVVQSFVRRAQAAARVAQLTELYRKQIELLDKKSQTSAAIGEDAARSGRSAKAGDEIKDQSFRNSRYGSVNSAGKWVFSDAGAKLYSGTDTSKAAAVVKIDAELEANQQQIDKVKSQITNEFSDLTIVGGGTGGGKDGSGSSTDPAQQAAKKVADAEFARAQAVEMATMEVKNGTATEAQAKQKEYSAMESLWKAYGDAYNTTKDPKYKEAQDKLATELQAMGQQVVSSKEAQKQMEEQARKNAAAWKKLEESSIALYDAQNKNDLGAFYKARDQYKAAGGGNQLGASTFEGGFTATEANVQAFIGNLKERIASSEVGTDLYNALTAQLADATALSNLLQIAIKNGIDPEQIGLSPQEFWPKIFGENPGDYIEDKTWTSIVDKMNKAQKKGGKKIQMNANTGEVTTKEDKGATEQLQAMNTMISSLGSIASGVQSLGIEVPAGITQSIGVLQTIMGIVSAIQSMQTVGTFLGIFAHGGIVHAAGGFSGIVPGHSYSGDNVPAMLNSGETVLNVGQSQNVASALIRAMQLADSVQQMPEAISRSQQAGLASQLEGGGANGLHLTTEISAEKLRIVLNNNSRRRGQGEYVTSKNVK